MLARTQPYAEVFKTCFYTTALFQTRYGQESVLWEPVDTVLFFRFIIAFSAYYLYARVAWENTGFRLLLCFIFPFIPRAKKYPGALLCTFITYIA